MAELGMTIENASEIYRQSVVGRTLFSECKWGL